MIVPEARRKDGYTPAAHFYRNCYKTLVSETGILYILMEVHIKRPHADPAKHF